MSRPFPILFFFLAVFACGPKGGDLSGSEGDPAGRDTGEAGAADCDPLDPAINNSTAWYLDRDQDGHGQSEAVLACTAPEGHVAQGDDCDDLDPTTYPGATELCGAVDHDCDGLVNEADAADARPWFPDEDGDGAGAMEASGSGCEAPEGCLWLSGDCDDLDPAVSPTAVETCDGRDEDCDGAVDEELATFSWAPDADGDGYGDSSAAYEACAALDTADIAVIGDCDDGDPAISPEALEGCGATDGIDEDCDGITDPACGTATLVEEDWRRWDDGSLSRSYSWEGVLEDGAACPDCERGWVVRLAGPAPSDLFSDTIALELAFDEEALEIWYLYWDGTWLEGTLGDATIQDVAWHPALSLLVVDAGWYCSSDECGHGGITWGSSLRAKIWPLSE